MRAFAAAISAAALAIVTFPALATTLHVCPDGSGDYTHLRAAVAAAQSGDVIELCAGVFTGPDNAGLQFGPKDLVIRSILGPEATTIDFSWINEEFDELWCHPGLSVEAGTTTRFEGVTLRNAGNCTDGQWGGDGGSAIYCVGGTLILDGVHIESSFSGRWVERGGGVFLQGGVLTARDCEFRGLRARFAGGAIFSDDSQVELQRCVFSGNLNPLWLGSGAEITDCLFEDNFGPENPGIVITAVAGQVEVTGSTFRSNFAQGIWNRGTLFVEGCLFEENVADYAPAISSHGTAHVMDSIFRGNLEGFTGPGAVSCSGQMEFDRCLFVDNVSRHGNAATILCRGGTIAVRSCTFSGNGASGLPPGQGSTIRLFADVQATIENTIVAFGLNYDTVQCAAGAGVTVTCSDFYGNGTGNWVGCVAGLAGTGGNLSADPLFCDIVAGNFTLHSASPCAPAQSGSCDVIGALPVACGPTPLQETTWGSIKALYR